MTTFRAKNLKFAPFFLNSRKRSLDNRGENCIVLCISYLKYLEQSSLDYFFTKKGGTLILYLLQYKLPDTNLAPLETTCTLAVKVRSFLTSVNFAFVSI